MIVFGKYPIEKLRLRADTGLDGFSGDAEKNYFSRELINPSKGDAEENPRNAIMRKELARVATRMELRWLTSSLYR